LVKNLGRFGRVFVTPAHTQARAEMSRVVNTPSEASEDGQTL